VEGVIGEEEREEGEEEGDEEEASDDESTESDEDSNSVYRREEESESPPAAEADLSVTPSLSPSIGGQTTGSEISVHLEEGEIPVQEVVPGPLGGAEPPKKS